METFLLCMQCTLNYISSSTICVTLHFVNRVLFMFVTIPCIWFQSSLHKHFQMYMYVVMLFIRKKVTSKTREKKFVEYVINAHVLYVKPK